MHEAGRIKGNPEVTSSPVGLVPTNAQAVTYRELCWHAATKEDIDLVWEFGGGGTFAVIHRGELLLDLRGWCARRG
jgi:hypothetical protein